MSLTQGQLFEKRTRLLARCEAQRGELSFYYDQLDRPVRKAEAVFGVLRDLRRSPLALTGLSILLVRTPWRKLARVPKFAWRGWKILRFVRSWTA